MGWYAASAIMYTKFKDGDQNKYPAWENVFLIEAQSAEEALEKAQKRSRMDEGDSSGTYSHESRPATLVFAGIRKIIECENLENRPTDGTEITYSRMELDNEEVLNNLINGEPAYIKYEE